MFNYLFINFFIDFIDIYIIAITIKIETIRLLHDIPSSALNSIFVTPFNTILIYIPK